MYSNKNRTNDMVMTNTKDANNKNKNIYYF